MTKRHVLNTLKAFSPPKDLFTLPQVRISLIREEGGTYSPKITQSQDVFNLSGDMMDLDREEFRILLLDAKHHVSVFHTVAIGSLTTAIVHPREVYKAAVLANAAAIIPLHNHPSGDPEPSPEDRTLTKRLSAAGELLGIRLLDHVIIGHGRFYSFSDHGGLS